MVRSSVRVLNARVQQIMISERSTGALRRPGDMPISTSCLQGSARSTEVIAWPRERSAYDRACSGCGFRQWAFVH
jgi:hypothetical protein